MSRSTYENDGESWDYTHVPLNDDQLIALGRVAYWAGALESTMLDLLIALSDDPEVAEEELRRYSFEELAKAVTKRATAKEIQYLAQFLAIVGSAREAMRERNVFFHGTWLSNGVLAIRMRNERRLAVADTSDVERVAERLFAATDRLLGYVTRYTWPPRQSV